jgi:flagellar FliL protein
MTDTTAEIEAPAKKAGKAGLLIGLVLALVGAGLGFYAVQSGFLGMAGAPAVSHEKAPEMKSSEVEFVPLEPLTISISGRSQSRFVRFRTELEVAQGMTADVQKMMPRVVDVLNGYLRALTLADLEDPMALTRMRAQILRRVQIVLGDDVVRDVLIMEFVLN